MESYLICDSNETLQGMRMSGVLGEIIIDRNLILKKIDKLIADENIGIIILTKMIKQSVEKEVMIRKLRNTDTLIVEIPGPNDLIRSDFITKYIKESIGTK